MKNLFSKFKRIFVFLLVIPMLFIFSACGGKKNNDNKDKPTGGIEQPGGNDSEDLPGGSEDDGEEDDEGVDPTPEVQEENFSVELNYNLPIYIADLLPKETKTAKVEEGYTLPTFEETEYFDCFDGWYKTGDDINKITEVSGEKDAIISVVAKWKETEISNYFYTKGLNFEVDDENDTASISSYSGDSAIVVIPQFYVNNETTYAVDSISVSAFKDNKTVKEVRSYSTDYYVGANAFENSSLEKIEFSKISSIGKESFKNSNITRAVFSNKLVGLSESAFENCTKLTLVDFSSVLGQGFSTLSKNLFKGCSKLSEIYLSMSTTSIGVGSFEGCSSIEDLDFIKNSSVTKLGNNAFASCLKLDKIEIPKQIVSYGTNIFKGCGITEIVSPLVYDDIYDDAGTGFSIFYGDLSSTLEKVTITGGESVIPADYFRNYKKLTDIIMDNSITKVENNAFEGCTALENITFSTGLVGDNINILAFEDTAWYSNLEDYLLDNSLTDFVFNNTLVYVSNSVEGEYEIADSVIYIGENVFASKTKITSVKIPASVEYINFEAFKDSFVKTITVDANNENYTCLTGTFFVYNDEDHQSSTTGTYSTLYELDNAGNEVTLIAYAATISGGTYVVPNTVTKVYDIAFDLVHSPEYVFVYSQSAKIQLNGDSNVSYVFENENITTAGNSSDVRIYTYLPKTQAGAEEDNYVIPDVSLDGNETIDYSGFNFKNQSGYNLIIIPEKDGITGQEVKRYFIVDHVMQAIERLEVII